MKNIAADDAGMLITMAGKMMPFSIHILRLMAQYYGFYELGDGSLVGRRLFQMPTRRARLIIFHDRMRYG